jgi:MFS family permease
MRETLRPDPTAAPEDPVPFVPRNFWAWVGYQFFYRVGWQFKMEATMVAGLISFLTTDPRTLGFFTTINTLGRQSAPLLVAPQVARAIYKRNALLLFWGAAVACWLALTVFLWLPVARNRDLALYIFGVCYSLFFIFLGSSSVAQGALLGKIIPATMRGRAMAVGMGLSGAINVGGILILFQLVRGDRFPAPQNYALAFSVTVACFLAATATLLAIREWPSRPSGGATSLRASLRYVTRLARENRNLRLLMLVNVAVAVGSSLLQFYTAYWRRSFPGGHFPEAAIVVATVFQVFWQSLSSAILGRVSDARGNRVVICSLLWVEACVPLTAMALGTIPVLRGPWNFLAVYTLIGIRFPVYQLLVNYLLEVVPLDEQAMGLGAVNTIQILTAPAPLLLGFLAARLGYPAAFLTAALFLVFAALAALRLDEPRRTGNSTAEAPRTPGKRN